MSPSAHDQAEKIYQQILDQLEALWLLYADADDNEEEEDDEQVDNRDIADAMVEEAAERGMDEESVERVFKSIAALAKKAEEE